MVTLIFDAKSRKPLCCRLKHLNSGSIAYMRAFNGLNESKKL